MCYWILTKSCIVLARSTVQPVSKDELQDPVVIKALRAFDAVVSEKLNDKAQVKAITVPLEGVAWDKYNDQDAVPYKPKASMPDVDDYPEETFDKYISAQVLLPKGDSFQSGRVKTRKRDFDGNPVGVANANPLLDTRVNEVEFAGGHSEAFAANIIAESLYSQVDAEGDDFTIIQEICDHKKDGSAVSIADGPARIHSEDELPRDGSCWSSGETGPRHGNRWWISRN
jgi:hypothetical protein